MRQPGNGQTLCHWSCAEMSFRSALLEKSHQQFRVARWIFSGSSRMWAIPFLIAWFARSRATNQTWTWRNTSNGINNWPFELTHWREKSDTTFASSLLGVEIEGQTYYYIWWRALTSYAATYPKVTTYFSTGHWIISIIFDFYHALESRTRICIF